MISRVFRFLFAWVSVGLLTGLLAQPIRLGFEPASGGDPGWIQSAGRSNWVHFLEFSPDLRDWRELAVVHHGPFSFPDFTGLDTALFVRARSRPKLTTDDRKNLVMFPGDAFANEPENVFDFNPSVRWIKFAIRVDEPHRVHFQDSVRYPFHYDFARLRLAPFAGMSRAQFDAATLHPANQMAVLGAVLLPPAAAGNEFGIQLVGLEEYPREVVARWFRLVKSSVQAPPGARVFYVPTFEQTAPAQREQSYFSAQGIDISDAGRWVSADACYSEGWAFGRLVLLKAAEVSAAYGDGRLRPDDILVLDGVPAEVPFVAGLLTLRPATPNSHVALLARSYSVPFGYPASAEVRSNIVALAGREVLLRVSGYRCEVKPVGIEGPVDTDLRAQLLALKRPTPLVLTPKARLGAYSTNTTQLKPADLRYVGGKAANYGLLRRVLPTNSPPAIALTLDLWDDFMAQVLPGGMTLAEAIRRELEDFTYPPNVSEVRTHLARVRDLIRKSARFTAAQQQAIVEILQNSGLPVARNIRFRSSTNVEDTEQFTGAGLYDSYSGCLPDDLDGDGIGPSRCDPTETDERGVFRAIQRVYASFYNENAFLERLRHEVNEDQVGMAVLVAESFPDEDELANGVTTLNWNATFGTSSSDWEMVTQPGAESVTNPDPAARPEVVEGFNSGGASGSVFLTHRQSSGLVPLGAKVLGWEAEYKTFASLFLKLAAGYQAMTGRREFELDFEFKKSASRGLQVKQVRLIPPPKSGGELAPFLFNEPGDLLVDEGELSDLFATHRLKSVWRLGTRSLRVDAASLATTIYTNSAVTFARGTNLIELTDGPSTWPEFQHSVGADGTTDSFAPHVGIHWSLETSLSRTVHATAIPWQTQFDLNRRLTANYSRSMPAITWEGNTTITQESVTLVAPRPITVTSLLQVRQMRNASGTVTVDTRFYWPEPPRGPTAGYTAPNIGFVESRITGVISEPIVLHSYWSQTYRPEHHNFAEHFIFEPRLEAGLPENQRVGLAAANIRLIHVFWDHQDAKITVLGLDDNFRELK